VEQVLKGNPEWTREDVRQALEAGAALFPERAGEGETLPADLSMPETVTLYTDGASRGNPGPAGAGAVFCDDAGNVLAGFHEYLGETTNNVAEYRALLLGLKKAEELGVDRILFRCDSELMARQLSGRYKVKSPNLKGLYEEVRKRTARLEFFRVKHVYREGNSQADALANQAIDEAMRPNG
jgi:ribonuclease HI